jgi:thiol-disulfide isomerase/thioredoxin
VVGGERGAPAAEAETVHDSQVPRPADRGWLAGKAVAASGGEPLAGAVVRLVDGEDRGEFCTLERTDADGRFLIERALHHGFVEAKSLDGSLGAFVAIRPETREVVVRMVPTATARGVLVDEQGEPAANRSVTCWGRYAVTGGRKPPSWMIPEYVDQDFSTDGEGRFTLPGLIVGRTYGVTLSGTIEDVGIVAPQAPGTMEAVALRIGYGIPALPESLGAYQPIGLDGAPLDLKDLAGKYVLLDFWATWCGPGLAELPRLREVYDAFGKDDRFRILSLSLDRTIGPPRAYQEKRKRPWPQGYLGVGAHGSPNPDAFQVPTIPTFVLVRPDGKVIARRMHAADIKKAVEQALAKAK